MCHLPRFCSCLGLLPTRCPRHDTPGWGAFPSSWSPGGCPHFSDGGFHTNHYTAPTSGRGLVPRGAYGHPSDPYSFPPPSQGILRTGLEEVRQFFALNGSCRLPLSPSLLVKGIVPRVSDWWVWALGAGRARGGEALPPWLLTDRRKKGISGPLLGPRTYGLSSDSRAGWRNWVGG